MCPVPVSALYSDLARHGGEWPAVAPRLPGQIRCHPPPVLRVITVLVIIRGCHWMLMWRTVSTASPRPSSSWYSWAPSLRLMRRVTGPGYYEAWRIASCYIVITNVKYLTQIFHTPRLCPGPSCFQLGISHCWVRGEFRMNGLKYQMIPCPLFSPFIS